MNFVLDELTYNSISFSWEMSQFLDRNGPNFQYVGFYRVSGSTGPLLNVTVTTNAITLLNLMSFTSYTGYVQAQNSAGLGMQSILINATTQTARELMLPFISRSVHAY